MELRLKTGKNIKDILILNTYAPHMGYKIEHIQKYWNKINAYISLIPKKYIRMWCTDNNGQLRRNDTNENNIGNWTLGKKMDNTNGEELRKCCENNDLVASNTFFTPYRGVKSNLATWHSYDGEYSKRIDYFLIDKKQRNWVKNICNDENANISNPMQHRAIIVKIKIKLKAYIPNKDKPNNCPYEIGGI